MRCSSVDCSVLHCSSISALSSSGWEYLTTVQYSTVQESLTTDPTLCPSPVGNTGNTTAGNTDNISQSSSKVGNLKNYYSIVISTVGTELGMVVERITVWLMETFTK